MLVNYSISLKALDSYVEGYNEQQNSRSTQIRGAIVHTAKELIRLYGVSLLKSNKVKPVTEEDIPSLRTNNIQMGKITKTSGRTIQRHIKRLQEAQIISEKIWHGSNSSYELWINPKILWIKGLKNLKNLKNKRGASKILFIENQTITNDDLTNCPHTDTSNTTRYKNNTLIAVDKLKKVWQEPTAGDLIFTGNVTGDKTGDTQLKDLKKNNTQLKEHWRARNGSEKRMIGGRQTLVTTSESLKATGSNDPTRHSFLVSYAEKLWKLALEKLYPNKILSKNQHKTAKKLLYQWYSPVATEKLENTHRVYSRRIDLVVRYLEKDPSSRFVTLPDRYFNPHNPNGFAGTKSWYEKDKKHQIKLLHRKILREQIRKYKKNLAQDTATGRPILTVYRECEQRIGKLGEDDILDEFYAAVLGENTKNNHLNFTYYERKYQKKNQFFVSGKA